MNSSLVPANTKKATLVFGFLRPLPDLPILIGGIFITVLLLAIFGNAETWLLLIFCVPMLLCGLLVMPIPNYHNTLCVIQSVFRFYNERRNYIWRGWCMSDEFKERK